MFRYGCVFLVLMFTYEAETLTEMKRTERKILPIEEIYSRRSEVPPHSVPSMVFLRIRHKITTFSDEIKLQDDYCSGSLISNNYILSSAECFFLRRDLSVIAVLGAHNLSMREPDAVFSKIDKVIIHEGFNRIIPQSTFKFVMGTEHDIALLKLAQEMKPNKFIKPIMLPKSHDADHDYATETLRVYTWYSEEDPIMQRLLKVSVAMDGKDQCEHHFIRIRPYQTFLKEQLCGYPSELDDCYFKPCSALGASDAGAPLVRKTSGGEVLAGITLFVPLQPTSRDKFTSVAKYTEWIKEKSGGSI